MAEIICIVCPKGCHLSADGDLNITGNGCVRGPEYAKKELTHPTRVVTSTVRVRGAPVPRLPVKTDRDIPKHFMLEAVRLLDTVEVHAPVKRGDVVFPDILGTGANFVATRTFL